MHKGRLNSPANTRLKPNPHPPGLTSRFFFAKNIIRMLDVPSMMRHCYLMTTTKHIHTETTFASLAAQQGATVEGNTYVAADGITRYWSQAGCTRCGIDGVMFHFVISRVPITPAQEVACLREWATLNATYSN